MKAAAKNVRRDDIYKVDHSRVKKMSLVIKIEVYLRLLSTV